MHNATAVIPSAPAIQKTRVFISKSSARSRAICLPILTRSASLLELLLQDGTVDLELTASVVSLDPGLAFTTLQLANGAVCHQRRLTWRLPQAIVESGQERFLRAVRRAPRIESYFSSSLRNQLRLICLRSVVRGLMAQQLALRCGQADPDKSYLAGLLFELPSFERLPAPLASTGRAVLFETHWQAMLPSDVALALRSPLEGELNPAADPLRACLLLADRLLEDLQFGETSPAGSSPCAISDPQWRCWPQVGMGERDSLIHDCLAAGRWAATSVHRMEPWEFTARLAKIQHSGVRHARATHIDR